MSDLWQGVSPSASHVLNLLNKIHEQAAEGLNSHLNIRTLPLLAVQMTEAASCPAASLDERRDNAAHAAARLLAFVELADAELAAGQGLAA